MIFDVKISEQAERDLRGIFEYIAFVLLSPQNAAGQLKRLEDAISKLDQMPERFRNYEREPWLSFGLRVYPVDNYLVFYIPDSDTMTVTVIRVMYSGQDVGAELERFTGYGE